MSPWPHRFLGLRRRQLFNIYLLVGSVGIVLAVTLFTLQLTKTIERQSRLTTFLFSSLASRYLAEGPEGEIQQQLFQTINEIEIPFIMTDNAGRPVVWNPRVIGIEVPDYQILLQTDPSAPSNPDVAHIVGLVKKFDEEQQPFAILEPSTGRRLGTLHYGTSALTESIRWMPQLELLLLAVFFLLIVWALQIKKEGEQQRLFAGMAKETAHQLGTPITSILGWLEILREKVGQNDDVMMELGRDVERLSKVSARFSQIGSKPKLEDSDLISLVENVIAYFQRRLPQLGSRVELRTEGTVSRQCRFNRDLLEWVLENLIKNGIDSLKAGQGSITISLSDDESGGVAIEVRDTGCGIPAGVGNKIFEPGFTTKSRGWGMGLALVKRIVTQYHQGRIQIAATGSQGTTFLINLPGEESARAV